MFESEEQIIELMIEKEFSDVPIMVDIAREESGLDPYAYNPEWHKGCQGSYSIFQIACIHFEQRGIYGDDRFNVITNIMLAREIFDKSGFIPWGVCKKLVKCVVR